MIKNRLLKITFAAMLCLTVAPAVTQSNADYSLTKYHIDIQVNENNTFQITERITANYRMPRHGITREIPMRNEAVRLDGKKSRNRARITDIRVDGDPFTVYNETGKKNIQIGDPDRTVTGSRDYVITYLYDIGKDRGKGYDEFYFNLIGTEWDTSIENITFAITMPKAFDAAKLGFSSGALDATDSDRIDWQVAGTWITGSYDGVLHAGEALTVRLELPEGYFVGAENHQDVMQQMTHLLPFLFMLITFLIWLKYGKQERPVEPVEYYPPKGYNSAETGFLYKGYVDTQDVTSLLIYLAGKGYINITETEEKQMFKTVPGYIITKRREYDGTNPNERLFLEGLFQCKSKSVSLMDVLAKIKNSETPPIEPAENDMLPTPDEVRLSDLANKFYLTLNAIAANMKVKENIETIFNKNSIRKNYYVYLMCIVTFILITIRPVLEYHDLQILIFALLFPGIGFSICFLSVIGTPAFSSVTINGQSTTNVVPRIVFGLLFGLLFGGVPFLFIVLPALLAETSYWINYLNGMICIAGMLILSRYMKKRTPIGNELLGRIRGFKHFLEVAEKHRLETLVMQKPDYFYHILPYTYVLGVSDKWIKKFENIALQPPDWFTGTGSHRFHAAQFGRSINTAMNTASKSMSSSPSSSRSGGGSSGRGSGGGGGRSW